MRVIGEGKRDDCSTRRGNLTKMIDVPLSLIFVGTIGTFPATRHYSTYCKTTKAMVKNNVKYKLTTHLRPLGLNYSSTGTAGMTV